jgi:hypothetical protein
MAIVPLSLNPDSEARALLRMMLAHGDVVGTDHAGRTVLQLAMDSWTLDRLCAFDAATEDLEDADGEPEPDHEIDSAPIVLDEVRAKRASRALRCLPALALALPLAIPHLKAHANQAAVVAPLPMSTAQTASQC